MSSKIKSRQLAGGDAALKQKIVNSAEDAFVPVILLRRYCELTGDTAQAVHDRRQDGEWEDGKQCHIKRRRLWIDLPEVANWVRSGR
jgi:hypothetical protein